MAVHTVYPLAGLGKDKFVDARFAYFTFKAMGMIRVIPGHNSLVQDRQIAYIATI
jgi:hypothetical protein